MKTILFGRHAKSSWEDFSLKDHDRPLKKRGNKDASIIGEKLVELGYIPELIISSSAVRAQKTAEIYAGKLNGIKIDFVEELYLAPVHAFINLANNVSNKYQTIMMIAHNPALTELANIFSGSFIKNVPTSGILKVDFDVNSWRDINTYDGKLIDFLYPKKFKK